MKFLNQFRKYILQDKAGGGDGGGGGSGGGSVATPPAGDTAKELADLKAKVAAYEAKDKEAADKKAQADKDLTDKAKDQKDLTDKTANDHKALEAALSFSLKSESWLKENKSVLNPEIADIFKAAESETYETAIEKDRAIKSGIIKSFFSKQEHMDLLTAAQKNNLENYLKLTNTGRDERAQEMFDSIFEPALKFYKGVKKQNALSKGHGEENTVEEIMKNKMIAVSKKQFLGV